jgi:hypothetical protein
MNTRKNIEYASKTEEPSYQGLWAPRIGRLAASNQPGQILVECDGFGTKAARLVSGVSRSELTKPENRGREVLVVFEEGDPDRLIIVGLMEDTLESLVSMELHDEDAGCLKDAQIDGKRVTIEAEEEIVLKCGSGSITLRKDGKIVIKGMHLLSRSSGPNRIKGGSVQIN